MAQSLRLSELFESRKYTRIVLAAGVITLLVLELAIYFAVSSQSGFKSRVVILDSSGSKLYESAGTALTSYEKMVFENNFGPLRNYNTHVETESMPFPYRTWILLAIGVPMGLILLLFFLVQVWMILLNGNRSEELPSAQASAKSRTDTFMRISQDISVLHVGFLIVLVMLIFWLIPSLLGDVAKSCFDAVRAYPFFFLGLTVFSGGLLVWVIYLRYRLSKQMLTNQFEIEKYRIQTELLAHNPDPHLLTAPGAEGEESRSQLMDMRKS